MVKRIALTVEARTSPPASNLVIVFLLTPDSWLSCWMDQDKAARAILHCAAFINKHYAYKDA